MFQRDRLWLCVAPILFCFLDQALTLYGQPPEYWAGNRTTRDEGNPIVAWCLELHPAAIAGETVLWILLFGSLILVLPWRQGVLTLSLGVTLGHLVGSATWLWWRFDQYWLFPILLLSSAALIVWTWERAAAARVLTVEPTDSGRRSVCDFRPLDERGQ
jgi:hypothetical protein